MTFKVPAAPKCPVCSKSVYKVEEVLALNESWHKTCFKCGINTEIGCGRVLTRDSYSDHGGKPFCKACYSKLFGPKGIGFGNTLGDTGIQTTTTAAPTAVSEDLTTASAPYRRKSGGSIALASSLLAAAPTTAWIQPDATPNEPATSNKEPVHEERVTTDKVPVHDKLVTSDKVPDETMAVSDVAVSVSGGSMGLAARLQNKTNSEIPQKTSSVAPPTVFNISDTASAENASVASDKSSSARRPSLSMLDKAYCTTYEGSGNEVDESEW